MSVQSINSRSNAGALKSSSQSTVSAAEWQTRVDLAACYRLLAHFGVTELTYNHLSARVPGEPDRLLVKGNSVMFEEVTASNLLKFEMDGTPCQDSPHLRGGALVIHAGILKARPDIHAVFHTHTAANMGVSAQKHGLLMLNQHAIYFYDRLSYHDFSGFEFDPAQRDPLVESLGTNRVAILRNHGALVCGRNLPEAFVDHYFLETACRGQIAALAGGAEVTLISEEVCRHAVEQQADRRDNPKSAGDKDWAACLRMADRLFPEYKS